MGIHKKQKVKRDIFIFVLLLGFYAPVFAATTVPQEVMQRVYNEVKTPYKYGLVVAPVDNYHKIDCPTVFREKGKWYMSYIVYNGKEGLDGRGYETWLAVSEDLLHWQTLGCILSYPQGDVWDKKAVLTNRSTRLPALTTWFTGPIGPVPIW
jgi:beta-galactosidase